MAIEIIPDRLEALAKLHVKHGNHHRFEEGACAMELVAWIAGEPHSDRPKCVCPVLTSYVIHLNDSMPDDATRDRFLKPLLPRLVVGTVADPETEQKRAFALADAAIRLFTPLALDSAADELRKAGLSTEADALSSQATALRGLAAFTDEAAAAATAASWAAEAAREADTVWQEAVRVLEAALPPDTTHQLTPEATDVCEYCGEERSDVDPQSAACVPCARTMAFLRREVR